ncbi:hypothetical protein Pfo_029456 [Paulownia fortunei]|nr:hypothetical protein Pfo_029456 [Paulownia fortunei]
MGKIDAEASINHFSHPHPLKLLSFQSSTANRITCSACTKEASGFVYICESCSYCLHKPCSNMPRSLNHQADHKHTLTLLPTPAYTGGSFQCNACGVLGTGFCYHCAECQLDLHTVCAFMRSTVKGSAHDHALKLCFEPPYEDKAFICDVCGGSGSNHWLYRCDSCGFDAHLKCAKAPNVQPRTASQIQQNQQPQMDKKPQSNSRIVTSPQTQIFKSRSVHCPASSWSQTDQYFPPIFQQPQVGMPITPEPYPFGSQSSRQLHRYHTAPVFSTPSFVQQPTRNDAVQNVVQSVIEGLVEGAANQLGQALLQGALGN